MVYNINVNGENKQITYDEYRELTSYLKDETLGNTYRTTRQSFLKEKDFQYDEFNHTIKQSIPNSELKFKLALHDNIQGQTFINMLMEDQSLTDDVLQSIANADPNDNITLDNYNKAETKAAIIDAITNPDNDAFDLQRSRTIMADKLTIAAQKKHNDYYANLDAERQKEINALKGDERDTIYMPAIKMNIEKRLVDADVAFLNSDKDFPVQNSYNGIDYRKINGQHQIYQPPYEDKNGKTVQGKFINVTREQLISLLKLSERYGVKNRSTASYTTNEGGLGDGLQKKPEGYDDIKKIAESYDSVNRGNKNQG